MNQPDGRLTVMKHLFKSPSMKRLFLTLLFSASLAAFSQVPDTTVELREYNWSGPKSSHILHQNPDGSFSIRDPDVKPDTLRAICLVSLFQNGIAHARMGYVVITPGKRPVYLDCRKRALKLPQVGWGYELIDPNYKK